MSQQEAESAVPYSPDCLAEASVWMTRLKGDDRSPAVDEGLRKWLRASPENARAFEMATELWEETHNLRRILPIGRPAVGFWQRLRFPAMSLAAAASLALICAGLFIFARQHSLSDAGAVSTAVGEQRLLTLEDGSRVFLNTNTKIRVKYDPKARAIDLEGGEALFDVAKQADRPFIVHAGSRSIVALGTSFVVRYDQTSTAVTLVEGKIAVQERGGKNRRSPRLETYESRPPPSKTGSSGTASPEDLITLVPGQRLQVTPGDGEEIDRPSLEAATAWRRGQVILDETPLAEAVEEMNRYSNVRLSIKGPAAHLRISGLFQAGDSAIFANAIAKTYGLHVLHHDDDIELDGAP